MADLPDHVCAQIERAEVDLALSDDALVALNDAAIAVVQERGPIDPLAGRIERLVDALNAD